MIPPETDTFRNLLNTTAGTPLLNLCNAYSYKSCNEYFSYALYSEIQLNLWDPLLELQFLDLLLEVQYD